MYGTGISREGSLFDVGVELGLVKKSGAWFTYEGEQLGQGRENAKQFLIETPELMIEINERIRSQLAGTVLPAGGNGRCHRGGRRSRCRDGLTGTVGVVSGRVAVGRPGPLSVGPTALRLGPMAWWWRDRSRRWSPWSSPAPWRARSRPRSARA